MKKDVFDKSALIKLRLENLTCGLGLVAEMLLDLPAYDNANTSK